MLKDFFAKRLGRTIKQTEFMDGHIEWAVLTGYNSNYEAHVSIHEDGVSVTSPYGEGLKRCIIFLIEGCYNGY